MNSETDPDDHIRLGAPSPSTDYTDVVRRLVLNPADNDHTNCLTVEAEDGTVFHVSADHWDNLQARLSGPPGPLEQPYDVEILHIVRHPVYHFAPGD